MSFVGNAPRAGRSVGGGSAGPTGPTGPAGPGSLPVIQNVTADLSRSIRLDGPTVNLVRISHSETGLVELTYIDNVTLGQEITLAVVNTASWVVVKGQEGNIVTFEGDCLLDHPVETLRLIFMPGLNMWVETARRLMAAP